jgi:hypothetical protein
MYVCMYICIYVRLPISQSCRHFGHSLEHSTSNVFIHEISKVVFLMLNWCSFASFTFGFVSSTFDGNQGWVVNTLVT